MSRTHTSARMAGRVPGTLVGSSSSGWSSASELRFLDRTERVYVGFTLSCGGKTRALLDLLPEGEYEELWRLLQQAHFFQMKDCVRDGHAEDGGGWNLCVQRPGHRTITLSCTGGARLPPNLAPLAPWLFEKHARYSRRFRPAGLFAPEAADLRTEEAGSRGERIGPHWVLVETPVPLEAVSREALAQLFERNPWNADTASAGSRRQRPG